MALDASDGYAPHWFVTFSDMTTLLLTFFVMVVSFSELKSEEKYQALVDGFQQQFGSGDTAGELRPGQLRPRNSQLAHLAAARRNQWENTLIPLTQRQSLQVDTKPTSPNSPAPKPTPGTVLYFQEEQIELDEHQRVVLRQLAEGLRGRPRTVEIRGCSPRQTGSVQVRDSWDLSLERCRRVMEYLVEEEQIAERSFQISAMAVTNDPPANGNLSTQKGPRVELLLRDETFPE